MERATYVDFCATQPEMGASKMRIRMVVLTAAILAASTSNAEGQQPLVDHWSTKGACVGATAPYYYPTILRRQALASNEVVRGLPQDACIEMDLPDRLGGRGYVRIEAGRRMVYDRLTGRVLRLEECNNAVYDVAFLELRLRHGTNGAPGQPGERGERGPQGPPGDVVIRERSGLPWTEIGIGLAAAASALGVMCWQDVLICRDETVRQDQTVKIDVWAAVNLIRAVR